MAIVYVQIDDKNRIIQINSSYFIEDTTDWIQIDEGVGDKYAHAQGNYFDKPIFNDRGHYRYKLQDGVAVERTEEEMISDIDLSSVRKEKIALSKKLLKEYIAAHPITSTAHGGVEGTYSVTEEKQTLMSNQYVSYQAEKAVNPDAVLTWNETGKACEVWTEEEFLQLVVEIKHYVYPLVAYQQHLEEEIGSAETLEAINAVVISYENVH